MYPTWKSFSAKECFKSITVSSSSSLKYKVARGFQYTDVRNCFFYKLLLILPSKPTHANTHTSSGKTGGSCSWLFASMAAADTGWWTLPLPLRSPASERANSSWSTHASCVGSFKTCMMVHMCEQVSEWHTMHDTPLAAVLTTAGAALLSGRNTRNKSFQPSGCRYLSLERNCVTITQLTRNIWIYHKFPSYPRLLSVSTSLHIIYIHTYTTIHDLLPHWQCRYFTVQLSSFSTHFLYQDSEVLTACWKRKNKKRLEFNLLPTDQLQLCKDYFQCFQSGTEPITMGGNSPCPSSC